MHVWSLIMGKDPNKKQVNPKNKDWSWRSHSPPWSQIGQSNGWFSSRNSMIFSLLFLTNGLLVYILLLPTKLDWAFKEQDTTGFGDFDISIKHILQLPAIDKFLW
jgi:hypothetical protein